MGRLSMLAAVALLVLVVGLGLDRLTVGPAPDMGYCGRLIGRVAPYDFSGPPCDELRAQRQRVMALLFAGAVVLAVGGRWISRRYRPAGEDYRRY